jgi:hypothetical protein
MRFFLLLLASLSFVCLPGCNGNSHPGSTSVPIKDELPYSLITVNPLPFKVVHGDFNHDKRQDMAVVSKGYLLQVIMNNESGSFSDRLSFEAYVNNTSAAVADFNEDGKDDIIMLTETLFGPLFLGDGRGSFTRHDVSLPSAGRGFYIDSTDLNNDGLPDLIAAGLGGVALYINKGDLQFGHVPFRLDREFHSRYIAAADLSGNGYRDVFFPDYAHGTLYVIWNDQGQFSSPQVVVEKKGDTFSSALLLVVDDQQHIVVSLEHSGHLLFLDNAFNEKRLLPVSPKPYSLCTSDMNRDTFEDLIITHAPSEESNGMITVLFGPSFEQMQELSVDGLLYSSAAFDWNMDDMPDVFVTNYTGSSVIYIPSPLEPGD